MRFARLQVCLWHLVKVLIEDRFLVNKSQSGAAGAPRRSNPTKGNEPMYRKLAISVVSILGLMILVVAAQQPPQEILSPPLQAEILQGRGMGPIGYASPIGQEGGPYEAEYDLLCQSEELVKQFGRTEGEARTKIKSELIETLDNQFDLSQKQHEAEIVALLARVNKLNDLIQERQKNRRDIVNKCLEQLVGGANGAGLKQRSAPCSLPKAKTVQAPSCVD